MWRSSFYSSDSDLLPPRSRYPPSMGPEPSTSPRRPFRAQLVWRDNSSYETEPALCVAHCRRRSILAAEFTKGVSSWFVKSSRSRWLPARWRFRRATPSTVPARTSRPRAGPCPTRRNKLRSGFREGGAATRRLLHYRSRSTVRSRARRRSVNQIPISDSSNSSTSGTASMICEPISGGVSTAAIAVAAT